MSACKTLARSSFSCLDCNLRNNISRGFSSVSNRYPCSIPAICSSNLFSSSNLSRNRGFIQFETCKRRCFSCVDRAVPVETSDFSDEIVTPNLTLEPLENSSKDAVEEMLSNRDDVLRLMKMERRPEVYNSSLFAQTKCWFPYLDEFKAGGTVLSSSEVLEAMDPHIMEPRKERFRNVAKKRSYSICLVVEGLSDFGNVSAAFRSADALGLQSVHVINLNNSKRYRENRNVSMGAEKWLDVELWNSTQDCFKVLKSRGYRIATTHLGMDAVRISFIRIRKISSKRIRVVENLIATVSVYDMDWSCPTAIVVGNENRGISDEALELSDMHCSISMSGMVDSFNVSVAAGILMHHAVCDRTNRLCCIVIAGKLRDLSSFTVIVHVSRENYNPRFMLQGHHGDLLLEESQILLAEFSLRHSQSAISIVHEYAKRKVPKPLPKL
ncbi:hypothetical protein RHMOL_Rhmol10G0057800 [Rhododendron molle]|uniref:Uncharacterized protein n=1 Tax=Rhododendron molle TaxID=49168 RepID=A0ACC0LZB7_RHOML|nr:hypothetical protein RHMOL_Rhmol10G0057800 [Rhododendron molle]